MVEPLDIVIVGSIRLLVVGGGVITGISGLNLGRFTVVVYVGPSVPVSVGTNIGTVKTIRIRSFSKKNISKIKHGKDSKSWHMGMPPRGWHESVWSHRHAHSAQMKFKRLCNLKRQWQVALSTPHKI